MNSKLTKEDKLKIAYTYAMSPPHITMEFLANQFKVSRTTISHVLHQSIETLEVSRSIAIKIKNKAVLNLKNNGKSPYKTIESFSISINKAKTQIILLQKKQKHLEIEIKNCTLLIENLDSLFCDDINSSQKKDELLSKLNTLTTEFNYISDLCNTAIK